jgi:hypothetical protein
MDFGFDRRCSDPGVINFNRWIRPRVFSYEYFSILHETKTNNNANGSVRRRRRIVFVSVGGDVFLLFGCM